ncbi:MAG: threonylcarbamoyl-AMP synthase [Chloroflexi bacterium]|nr:threonylcarbamoyl-AMP synthase [Chloroflexota bacterium]
MQTKILDIADSQSIARALEILRAGNVIAFPTDTVYGMGANAFDERAIEKLFRVKERARDKAMPVLLADARDLEKIARQVPDAAKILAEKFWPGALTIIVPASPQLPKTLLASGDTIGARVPDHDPVRDLIRALGAPIVGTSANISGGKNPQTALDVFAQLNGRISLILDGGRTRGDVPSTVIDVTIFPPRIVRVGAVSAQEIELTLNKLYSRVVE